jgi:hypothetical protein
MNETKNILKEQLQKMPSQLREAFLATDIRTPLEKIASRHNLMLDQTAALENETVYVMIGLASGEDFVDNIVKEVEIETPEALTIAKEVEEGVFEEMRNNLQKKLNHDSAEEETEDRDSILKEIEKPTARASAIVTQPKKEMGGDVIKDRVSLEDIRAAHTPLERDGTDGGGVSLGIPEDHRTSEPKSMAETKLSEPTSNPHKKIDRSEKAKEEIKRNYPDDSDPYREPVS